MALVGSSSGAKNQLRTAGGEDRDEEATIFERHVQLVQRAGDFGVVVDIDIGIVEIGQGRFYRDAAKLCGAEFNLGFTGQGFGIGRVGEAQVHADGVEGRKSVV